QPLQALLYVLGRAAEVCRKDATRHTLGRVTQRLHKPLIRPGRRTPPHPLRGANAPLVPPTADGAARDVVARGERLVRPLAHLDLQLGDGHGVRAWGHTESPALCLRSSATSCQ